MLFRYLKMQGAGNQIVVVDQREKNAPPPSADEIRRLGNPASGPGFDQLMWVAPAVSDKAAASYRVFNRDGSEVEQCGNGVRCVAWMLARSAAPLRSFTLESPAGVIEATVLDDDQVSVSMGPPEFEPARVPFVAQQRADQYDLETCGRTHRCRCFRWETRTAYCLSTALQQPTSTGWAWPSRSTRDSPNPQMWAS